MKAVAPKASFDIGAWLRGLGLAQYEAVFREQGIDLKLLPTLTAQDLKDLGVGAVGHRRKLFDAIAEIPGASDEAASDAQPSPILGVTGAERRQLTVLVCDLVGSTALASRLDPEDMRRIIADYDRCCASAVASKGGYVAKYMGDGVLAYFGYPEAKERDPELAVEAGLTIVGYDLVWYAAHYPQVHLGHLETRMRQSGDYGDDEPLTRARLLELLRQRVRQVDVEELRNEVAPFVRQRHSLDVWSQDFFLQVFERIETCQ